MKEINLIILSTIIMMGVLLNFENKVILSYGLENIDRNIVPLLIPPYQMVKDLVSADINRINVTFVNNIP
jgi:hypothetical protein